MRGERGPVGGAHPTPCSPARWSIHPFFPGKNNRVVTTRPSPP